MALLTYMNQRRAVRLLVLCTIPLVLPNCKQDPDAGKVAYTVQLEPGSEWTWNAEINVFQQSTNQSQPVTVSSPMTLRLDLLVESIDEQGNYSMQATIREHSMDVLFTGPLGSLSPEDIFGYDRDPQREIARALENKSVTFTMAPDGALLRMDGLSELRREVESSLRFSTTPTNTNVPPALQEDFRQLFLSVLDDDYIPDLLETTFHVLPTDAVAAGDSWRVKLFNPANNDRGEYVLTLDSRADGVAYLNHATSAEDSRISPLGSMQGSIESGTVKLYEDTGIPMEHTQHLSAEHEVSLGQPVHFVSEIRLTVEIVPK